MDGAVAGLIGATIGALSGLAGGFLTGRRQLKVERDKWLQSRKDEIQKDIRLAAAELTRKIAAANHSMLWLTWKAHFQPNDLTNEDISDYDKEMHVVKPEIIGALMNLCALDENLYDRMNPFVIKTHVLDGRIAIAAIPFKVSRESATKAIAEFYEEAYPLYNELAQMVADMIGLRNTNTDFADRSHA
jgi:hypothetical protein